MSEYPSQLESFREYLLKYNCRTNLVSRKMTPAQLETIIAESLMVAEKIESDTVIDAGSGNGLLGIPIALRYPQKKIVLVEAQQKKVRFLHSLLACLTMPNVTVASISLQEYMHHQKTDEMALVARGFPQNEALVHYLLRRRLRELLLITSNEKAKKLAPLIEKCREKHYNIPSRTNLIILKLENVSRET